MYKRTKQGFFVMKKYVFIAKIGKKFQHGKTENGLIELIHGRYWKVHVTFKHENGEILNVETSADILIYINNHSLNYDSIDKDSLLFLLFSIKYGLNYRKYQQSF
jgi:hypothetical protein